MAATNADNTCVYGYRKKNMSPHMPIFPTMSANITDTIPLIDLITTLPKQHTLHCPHLHRVSQTRRTKSCGHGHHPSAWSRVCPGRQGGRQGANAGAVQARRGRGRAAAQLPRQHLSHRHDADPGPEGGLRHRLVGRIATGLHDPGRASERDRQLLGL